MFKTRLPGACSHLASVAIGETKTKNRQLCQQYALSQRLKTTPENTREGSAKKAQSIILRTLVDKAVTMKL